MRARKIATIVLDALTALVLVVLIIRIFTGDFRFEFGPMRIAAQRLTRVILALVGLVALRTLAEIGGSSVFRIARWPGRIAFGSGGDDEAWPFALRWWIVLPWLLGAAGAVFGLTHAGRILLDRAGAFDDPALGVFFLLSWLMPGLFLGLSVGAAWTLLLAFGRHLKILPAPSAKDVKLTLCIAVAGAAAGGQTLISDWTHPSRLGETGATIAAVAITILATALLAVVYPAMARRSRSAILCGVGIPLVALLVYGIVAPRRTDCIPEGRPPRHVVLISIDTTRADHLSCYGYERATSPQMDRLAAGGVRFERAMISRAGTDPSHVTMLTGLYAREHGVVTNGLSIANPDTPSLSEWFRARGYATAAITSRSHLNPDDFLLPGFDHYSTPTSRKATGTAPEVYTRASAWVDLHREEDFFLWVHFWDPHNSYDPPAPHRTLFNDGDRGPAWTCDGHQDEYHTDEEAIYRESLYDGEIHYADEYVGRFVRRLEAASPDEPPLVVLVGDHGEMMREYLREFDYAFDHSYYVNDALHHVPLIVRWPGRVEPRVVPDLVEIVNLAATIADLAHPGSTVAAPEGKFLGRHGDFDVKRAVQLGPRSSFKTHRRTPWYSPDSPFRSRGVSLVPLIRGEASPVPALAFAWRRAKSIPPEKWLGFPAFSVRDFRWRYVLGGRDGEALYDLDAEPFELGNVIADHPEVAKRLRREVDLWKLRIPETPPDLGSYTEDKAQDMLGLGYTD